MEIFLPCIPIYSAPPRPLFRPLTAGFLLLLLLLFLPNWLYVGFGELTAGKRRQLSNMLTSLIRDSLYFKSKWNDPDPPPLPPPPPPLPQCHLWALLDPETVSSVTRPTVWFQLYSEASLNYLCLNANYYTVLKKQKTFEGSNLKMTMWIISRVSHENMESAAVSNANSNRSFSRAKLKHLTCIKGKWTFWNVSSFAFSFIFYRTDRSRLG